MFERIIATGLLVLAAVFIYRILTGAKGHRLPRESTLEHLQLLYFYGLHCAACKAQAHYLSQLDARYQGFIHKMDVEAHPEVAKKYRVFTGQHA